MTDISDRLIVIRNHLRTGAVGQREVWEEWLKAAIDEIERLQALSQNNATSWDAIVKERDEVRAEKAALQTEIDRLRFLNDEMHKLLDVRDEADGMRAKLIDERECGYLALIEKHATENEKLKETLKVAEKMLYDSGFMLGEAHTEIKRLTLLDQIGKRQIELLRAERHTTKQMLEDVLEKYGLGRGGQER